MVVQIFDQLMIQWKGEHPSGKMNAYGKLKSEDRDLELDDDLEQISLDEESKNTASEDVEENDDVKNENTSKPV